MIEERAFDKRLWLIISIAACAVVVAYTAKPVFHNPQLEPDDYRYLEQVRYLNQDFRGNILKASVIENRWDQLWWINVHEKVRFFRPTVVVSYWLDGAIHGSNNPLGLVITNILIYFGCVSLASLIYYRWIGPGISFLVVSVLFASFFAHGEVMYYVAGRTDSLAAFFLLGCLALHIYGKERPELRWWAMPFFVLAILTKELTATLPLILFLSDLWIEKRSTNVKTLVKLEWKIYALYAVVTVCFLAIRARIISGPDTGYPYPYFVTLEDPIFLSHLFGQVNSYCANLLFAVDTVPFKIVTDFQIFEGLKNILPSIGVLSLCTFFLFRERKYWILVLFGLACWFPTIFLYQSERYLFLPSFAIAGVLGLLLLALKQRSRKIHYAALLFCVFYIGHQVYSLQVKNKNITENPRLPEKIGEQLNHLKPSLAKGSKLLLLNLPGGILQDQFAEDEIRLQLDDPDLDVTVITPMPQLFNMGARIAVDREGEHTITLRDTEMAVLMSLGEDRFPWVTLDSASRYDAKSGIKIEILSGSGSECDGLRVVLPYPVKDYVLLKWDPAAEFMSTAPNKGVVLSQYGRELNSTVQIVSP